MGVFYDPVFLPGISGLPPDPFKEYQSVFPGSEGLVSQETLRAIFPDPDSDISPTNRGCGIVHRTPCPKEDDDSRLIIMNLVSGLCRERKSGEIFAGPAALRGIKEETVF